MIKLTDIEANIYFMRFHDLFFFPQPVYKALTSLDKIKGLPTKISNLANTVLTIYATIYNRCVKAV